MTLVLLLGILLYLGLVRWSYQRVTRVVPQCLRFERFVTNTPNQFAGFPSHDWFDLTPHWISGYHEVQLVSRDGKAHLKAWVIPPPQPMFPEPAAIIIAHGFNGGRRHVNSLLPASVLARQGYTVLLPDFRDHGDSQIVDGRHAGGIEEAQDLLGAWDWLVQQQGIAPERIGLFGYSLGASAVLIAMGADQRVAAGWADSSFADVAAALRGELARHHIPHFLLPPPRVIKWLTGINIGQINPTRALDHLNGRPIFITHSQDDPRLGFAHFDYLVKAARDIGANVDIWAYDQSDHVMGMFDHHDEYREKMLSFFARHLLKKREQ